MTKLNRALLTTISSLLIANSLYAKETICYKKGWDSPSTIEATPLDGGECNSTFSVANMKEKGWEVLDIQIQSNQNLFDYTYVFNIEENRDISSTQSTQIIQTPNPQFTIEPVGTKITNIEENKSKIDVGNLIVGQTGIVVHIYDDSRKMIVSNAKVIESNATGSTVEFFNFDDLKQDAIPTTKREVSKGDILVLNYMYPASLLITPTEDSFNAVRENFQYNNFIHSDIFAAKLKIGNHPYPTKEDIQKFAVEQNLGTIFMVLEKNVYVLDTKTFAVLAKYPITYDDKQLSMPFYTRVEDIEDSIFAFRWFTSKEDLTYNKYYKKVLGLE